MSASTAVYLRRSLYCLALVLAGCPQSSSAPSAVARAACDYVERCAPWQLGLFPGGGVEGCAEFRDALLGAPSADDCADAFATLECDDAPQPFVTLSTCEYEKTPVRRRVGEGEDCSQGWCDDGLRCAIEGEAPSCDRRVCRKLPREGEACGPEPCASGLGCHLGEGICVPLGRAGEACVRVGCAVPLACIEGTCGDKRGVGEPCGDDHDCEGLCDEAGRCFDPSYAELGESCEERRCERGLHCDDGRCRPWGDVGEPCEPGSAAEWQELLGFSVPHDCRLGLGCVEGRCKRTTPGIARAGQACDRVVTQCDEGLYCGYDGRCQAIPTPRRGEACNPHIVEDYGVSFCLTGFCDRDQEVCVPYAAKGESCRKTPCDDGLVCLEGTCETPRADGEACESSQQCGWSASCDEDRHVCRCGY